MRCKITITRKLSASALSLSLLYLAGPVSAQDYFLIAGSFQEPEHAKQRIAELNPYLHVPVVMKQVSQEGKPLYLVKVDAHANYMKAVALQKELKNHGVDSVTMPEGKLTHVAENDVDSLPDTPAAKPIEKLHKSNGEPKVTKRLWNLRNADLRAVIQEVSRETGKNFLIDPRVEGKISIVSANPIDAAQLYQVFLSMLEVSGFSAVSEGNITKIVPNIDSKTMGAKVFGDRSLQNGEEVVVQVVPIKYVSAQQLVPILRPMMPQWTALSAYIPSNSLIISGRASNLAALIKIINRVDVSNSTSTEVIPLRNGIAADVAKTLSDLQQRQQPLGITPVAVAADDRANAILLSGSASQRARLHQLVDKLDTPNPPGANDSTQVIYLQFMQAKDIAPILAGVARSHFRGDVGVTLGTRTQDKPPALEKMGARGTTGDVDTTTTDNPPTENQANSSTNQTSKGQESSRPHMEIIAEPNTNTIIINAPRSLMTTLKAVVAKLDIRPMQVAVEALIAEINEDDVSNLGIDWGSRDNEFVSEGSFGTFTAGFGLIRKGGFSDFELQLHALASNNKADILSTPSVVVLDNHLAHIKVGKEVSVKESDYPGNANGGAPATPYNTFKRVPVALVLNVTPQITHDGSIKLLISHQNNTLQDPALLIDNPVFNISEISTSVIVSDGDILVLGGLIQNEIRDNDARIPVLGDFPGLGKVFHHATKNRFKKKLMVFLRPVIMKNQDIATQVTGSKYEVIREAELQELRERAFDPEYKENVLPNFQKPLQLPKPFLHHTERS